LGMAKILSVNPGSASRKFAIYDGEKRLMLAHIETESGKYILNLEVNGAKETQEITETDYKNDVEFILNLAKIRGVIAGKADIAGIGVRIVAPGEYFYSHASVDAEFEQKLAEVEEEAPLHIRPIREELQKLDSAMPSVKKVAISDSAFHAGLPAHARTYAIPKEVAQKYNIYRFGYHGISVQSVLKKIPALMGAMPERVIVCHLGSGASITAVRGGKSVDTSMGLTPLEGLPMGTRVGDIDAGALIFLGEKLGLNYRQMEDYLNNQAGFLGISGKTGDVRELLELEKNGNPDAALALKVFVYKIQKYIGAYAAAMGGVDLVVFTATIGERSVVMRERIASGLEFLGIALDSLKNTTPAGDTLIGNKLAVIATDELGEIAREAAEVLNIKDA
jgi:acetate kinase